MCLHFVECPSSCRDKWIVCPCKTDCVGAGEEQRARRRHLDVLLDRVDRNRMPCRRKGHIEQHKPIVFKATIDRARDTRGRRGAGPCDGGIAFRLERQSPWHPRYWAAAEV